MTPASRRLSLRGWFLAFSATLLVATVALASVLWLQQRKLKASRVDIDHDWEEVRLIFEAQKTATLLLTRIEEPGSVLPGDAGPLVARLQELVGKLEGTARSSKGGRQVNALEVASAGEAAASLRRLDAALGAGNAAAASSECAHTMGALGRFLSGSHEEVEEALGQLHRYENLVELTAAAGFLGIAAILAGAGGFLALRVVRPLRLLRRSVGRIGERRFELPAMPPAAAEIEELAASFGAMSTELGAFTTGLEQRVESRTAEVVHSRAKLQLMLESLPDAVALIEPGGAVVECNGAYRRLFGDGPQPESRDDEPKTEQGYLRRAGAGGSARLLEVRRFHSPGPRPLSLEYARDVTEVAEIEAALSATRQLAAIGGLSSAVAHEINNPLTTIGACAEGLQGRLAESGGGRGVEAEYLELIVKEVYRCKSITDRLLDVFRGGSPQMEKVSLRALAEDCLRIASVMCEPKGIAAVLEAEGEDEIESNADALRQIMANLLMNAVQACRSGGRIALSIAVRESCAEIAVSDDGRGIEPGDAEALFEPLRSGRRESGGTGIGLYLVRTLAEALGGTVHAASDGAGRGARFRVELPRAVAGRDSLPGQSAA